MCRIEVLTTSGSHPGTSKRIRRVQRLCNNNTGYIKISHEISRGHLQETKSAALEVDKGHLIRFRLRRK